MVLPENRKGGQGQSESVGWFWRGGELSVIYFLHQEALWQGGGERGSRSPRAWTETPALLLGAKDAALLSICETEMAVSLQLKWFGKLAGPWAELLCGAGSHSCLAQGMLPVR